MKNQFIFLLLIFVAANLSCSKEIYDNFSSKNSNWKLYKDSKAEISFEKGMNIKQMSEEQNVYLTKDFGNIKISEIECSVNHLEGATGVGLVWGFKDESTHNRFIITTRDQEYFILYTKNNEDEQVKTWTFNEAIAGQDGTNILKLKQSGSLLEFYVNSKLLYTKINSDLSLNEIGIFFGSTEGSRCKINYFRLTKK